MAEERTVSAFTKLNAPDRSRQKAETLVNMTKVRQHILREKVSKEGSKARTRLPLVKFRNLSKYLSSRKEQVLSGTSEVINAGSVSKPINVDLPDNANSRNEAVGREETMEVSDEIDEDLRAHAMESDSWANNRPYTPDGQSFDIEEMDGVNLNAPLLREFLSDSSVSCSNMADESEEDQREARPKRRMEKKVVVGTVHF
ncbi:hypothetical protein FRC03_012906 [Tulasnella sp. 419]|nr:hypothetical protein FRC03_012906 [Tulasnella sp. 419]